MWIRVHLVFQQIIAIAVVLRIYRLDLKLSHGTYQRFGTIQNVLVYCQTVQCQLVLGVAVLVYDLHLLDNG